MTTPVGTGGSGNWARLLLADENLAELVRQGWLTLPTLPTDEPPSNIPVAKFDELLAELRADRDAR